MVDIMKDNVTKVLERDQRLTDMEDKAESLKDGAQRFERTSTQVKKKMWTKNMKWTVAVICAVIALALVIVLIIRPWK